MTKLKYFGTSGIRGRTLIDITPAFAERMARAFAKIVLLSKKSKPHLVIGRDPRYGAETIELSVIVGLTASGVSVIRCGIVPTPVLSTYLKHTHADGAVMITGSHIPPDRIGLIFIQADGSYCSDDVSYDIEQEFESYETDFDGLIQVSGLNDLEKIGTISEAQDVYQVYENTLYTLIDTELLKTAKFRLCLDPGNGTGSHYFSNFLRNNLGYEVKSINDKFASKSDRLSEPIKENLSVLIDAMSEAFDLGIAFDVDADRATFVVYTKGEARVIDANETGAFLIKTLLEDGIKGEIVLPINSSNLSEHVMSDFELKPVYCKIGQPGTIDKVKEVGNGIFSYEESGKFYFLHNDLLWTDGILVSLKILEIMAKKKTSYEDLINLLPKFHSLVDKISIPDEKFRDFTSLLRKEIENHKFPNEIERITIDGYRINFSDKTWLLIRPSGTEPKIRMMSNSLNSNRCSEVLLLGRDYVEKLLSKIT